MPLKGTIGFPLSSWDLACTVISTLIRVVSISSMVALCGNNINHSNNKSNNNNNNNNNSNSK